MSHYPRGWKIEVGFGRVHILMLLRKDLLVDDPKRKVKIGADLVLYHSCRYSSRMRLVCTVDSPGEPQSLRERVQVGELCQKVADYVLWELAIHGREMMGSEARLYNERLEFL